MTEITWTQEEKEGLSEDLNAIGNLLASHDQSIFQVIATVNVIQRLLVDNGITTNDLLKAKISDEVKRMQDLYLEQLDKVQKEAEEASKEAPAANE